MSRRFYEDLDWSLLLMFAGLSSSSGGPQHALLTLDVSPPSAVFISIRFLSERRHRRSGQQRVGDADIEAVLSRRCPTMAGRWLTIAMASTLAGNFNRAGLDREPDRGGNWRVN
jgi:hypothetical protein